MARNRIDEQEYKDIKREYKFRRSIHPDWNKEKVTEHVALQFDRSMHTVARVIVTKNHQEYKYLSSIECRRNPDTTLGKQVKEQGKRLTDVEKHLWAIGA